MNGSSIAGRRLKLTVAGLIAVVSMVIVLAVSGAGESHAATHRGHTASVPVPTAKAVAFHDQMRALWEAHGSWTHMVIVSFAGNLHRRPALPVPRGGATHDEGPPRPGCRGTWPQTTVTSTNRDSDMMYSKRRPGQRSAHEPTTRS